jgi:hypothetical protein
MARFYGSQATFRTRRATIARRRVIQASERKKETSVASRSLLVVPATAVLLALCAGCAGSQPAIAYHALAPDAALQQTSQQTNPNAPYMVPAAKPQPDLPSPQATSSDAPPCDPKALAVEEISGNVNGVFRSLKLAFRNRGSMPCSLSGYPTVALLGTQGETLGSIATEKITSAEVTSELAETHAAAALPAPASPVTLMPNTVAAFQVVWTTGAGCPSAARLLVSAPGTEHAFAVTQPMKVCSGRVQVTELQPDQGAV